MICRNEHCSNEVPDGQRYCSGCGTEQVQRPKTQRIDHGDPLIGRTIAGKYEIISRLGEGGMGAVYRAKRIEIGDHVAIKVLLRELLTDRSATARFMEEAKLAARVKHPDVVIIHDVGETEDGIVFLVMELVEGETLGKRLGRGRLDPREAADILQRVCRAVQAAHDSGIVHRDLKPDNIVLSERQDDRSVKVLDFGIAKGLDSPGARGKTRTGMIIGTAEYMSPEQCEGRELTPASDIYSLGIVLYEMLAGHPPFSGESLTAVAVQHMRDEPPQLSGVAPHVSVAVQAVVMRALAKAPHARFQSASELATALGEAVGAASASRSRVATGKSTVLASTSEIVGRTPARTRSPVVMGVMATVVIAATLVWMFAMTPDRGLMSLSIRVEPVDSRVEVDGQSLTVSGGHAETRLEAGTHLVAVKKSGYDDVVESLVINKGVPLEKSFVLRLVRAATPSAGQLVLSVIPSDADILIDSAPVTLENGRYRTSLSTGSHVLNARKNGFVPVDDSFVIAAETTLERSIELRAIPTPPPPPTKGDLVIQTSPGGAEVHLGGTAFGLTDGTGVARYELRFGSHDVVVSKLGFESAAERIRFSRDGQIMKFVLRPLPSPTPQPTSDPMVACRGALRINDVSGVLASCVSALRNGGQVTVGVEHHHGGIVFERTSRGKLVPGARNDWSSAKLVCTSDGLEVHCDCGDYKFGYSFVSGSSESDGKFKLKQKKGKTFNLRTASGGDAIVSLVNAMKSQ